MRAKTSHLGVYIFLIGLAIFIGLYIVLNNRINSTYKPDYELDDFVTPPVKKVGVNEYKVSNITTEDMVYTYFNDFTSLFYTDLNASYNLLDTEYKDKKYSNYTDYYNYISSITDNFSKLLTVSKYKIETTEDKTIYKIKDTDGNTFIFSVSAVMQYSVYLDENTVKIE